jgi:hypothetical protein
MEIDFGGVVKEYAVDRAATLCWEAGARSGHVNLGGDIKVIGPRPDGAQGSSDPAGVEIESGGTRLRLRLRAVGRGAKLEALAPARPKATANRIDYQRTALNEWYLNGPLGLEQGFTFESPPGHATGEVLTLALDLVATERLRTLDVHRSERSRGALEACSSGL